MLVTDTMLLADTWRVMRMPHDARENQYRPFMSDNTCRKPASHLRLTVYFYKDCCSRQCLLNFSQGIIQAIHT